MIRVRVKRVNEKNEQDFFTTKINFTFLETIEYYLHQNKYYVELCFLTMTETVWQNVSVELLEG